MSRFRAHAPVLQRPGRGRYILILWLLFAACPAYCTDYYVATDGNDSNDGSIDHPFKTIPKAVGLVSAGDTIYLRGGQHDYSQTIQISKSGDANNLITLQNYQEEAAILDFSGQGYGSNKKGINLSGSYWHFNGFTVQHTDDIGVYVSGSHNILERLVTRRNGDTGLHLTVGASYNLVLNCDSYLNYDLEEHGQDADGFGAKGPTGGGSSLGPGNVFRGCRSWNNSDDGFDFWWAGNGVTVEDCWAFRNGDNVWEDPNFVGNGNGFKLGHGGGAHVLKRCIAYDHWQHGIDLNGNTTGVTIYNCTCVSNGGKNFYFDEHSSIHVMRNNLSHQGSVLIYDEIDDANNSWNGFIVSDADFASLDPNFPPITDPNTYTNTNSIGIDAPRGPDGELPKLRFLRLAPDSLLIDAGIDVNEPFYGDAPDLGAFEHLDGDCEPDGSVNWVDLWCLTSNWLDSNCGDCNGADFNDDGNVDLYDFAVMGGNWLK